MKSQGLLKAALHQTAAMTLSHCIHFQHISESEKIGWAWFGLCGPRSFSSMEKSVIYEIFPFRGPCFWPQVISGTGQRSAPPACDARESNCAVLPGQAISGTTLGQQHRDLLMAAESWFSITVLLIYHSHCTYSFFFKKKQKCDWPNDHWDLVYGGRSQQRLVQSSCLQFSLMKWTADSIVWQLFIHTLKW